MNTSGKRTSPPPGALASLLIALSIATVLRTGARISVTATCGATASITGKNIA
jgi:hypothetical protein